MNYPVFYALLAVMVLINLGIGFAGKKIASQNIDNYFLGGRNCGLIPLALTFLATQLGGGVVVGSAQMAFLYGFPGILYSSGLALGLICLSLGLGAKFRDLEVATTPELLELQFNSLLLRRFAAIIMVIVLFLILVAVIVSARQLFYALGFESKYLFSLILLAMVAYTTWGGLAAVIKTDMMQVGFILIGFIIIAAFLCFNLNTPDWAYLQEKISVNSFPKDWSDWLLMPFFFVIIGQDMGQRCFAAKSSATVTAATILAAMLLLACSILPVIIGVLASSKIIEFSPKYVFIDYLASVTNPYMASLFAMCILMAIISTTDSLLCAMSSSFSYDLFGTSSGVSKAKTSTLIWGIAAILVSFFVDNIIPVMLIGYKLAVATFFVPVILAALRYKISNFSVWLMVIQGAVLMLSSMFFAIPLASIYAVLLAFSLAIIDIFFLKKHF